MRKLYSLVLMAIALLIGTNAWATSRDEIQQQIDQASNGGIVNITLNSDVTIDTPIRIYAKKDITGKTVNIDLAGHTISNANNNNTVLIELLKGTLNITGEGTISQGSTADGAVAIKVYGYEDPVVENWSVLNLGEKVIVSSTDEGVSVYGLFGPYYTYVKHSSGETVYDYDGKVYDGTTGVHYYNEYSTYSTYKYGSSSYSGHPLIASGAIDYVTSYPAYYKWTSGGYGCSTSGTNKYVSYYEKSKAFGVNITIAGNVHAKKYGVKINGTIKYPRVNESDHLPYIHITKTADISSENKTAIYSSGLGEWLIEGYLHGPIGLYAKSGEITINDAVIESTSKTGTYQTPSGTNSGIDGGTGSAVVVESNSNYAGNISVTIEGDTRISGGSGYAVQEVITNTTETKVSNIDIQGGTFEQGSSAQGAISITDKTAGENKVTIYGANITGEIVGDLSKLLPDDTHVTEVVVDGKTIVVVSEGDGPADEAKKAEWDEVAALSNKTNPVDAAWTAAGTGTIDGTTIYLGELQIISGTAGNLQQLTIKKDAALVVDKLIMNDYARIIVEAGGMLIVTGTLGINAPVVENIVLKSTEDKQAYFLFHPNVSSNKYPNATVELYTNCKQLSESPWTYTYQRFALPIIEGATPENDFSGSLFGSETAFENYVWEWNGSSWVVAPNWASLNPFKGYQLANNSSAGGVTYKFKGQLVGNGNANYEFPTGGYDAFGSSHMAPIYIDSLLKPYETSNMEATVWVYDYNTSNFKAVTSENIKEFPTLFKDEIKPMDAFVLRIQASSGSSTMSYASAIWGNPNFDAAIGRASQKNPAPARVRTNASNRAIISIVAENGYSDQVTLVEKDKFSAEFDNGADASKYMYENGINLYAVTEAGDLSSVATDNLAGTMLSFRAGNDTQYTINFTNVLGEDYALRDNVTGQVITLTEGTSYSFMQEANSTVPARFEIVGRQNMPTAIDNVEEAAKATGIYTITGQYLGRDFSNLPAGVYIVNGVKVVK